jgi:hypothetical protein
LWSGGDALPARALMYRPSYIKPAFLLLIAFHLSPLAVWGASNTSNFVIEMKSPLMPAKYKSKAEASRAQKLKQQELKRDIDRYKKEISGILQKYQDRDGENFSLVDYLKEYPVIESTEDSSYSVLRGFKDATSYRFKFEDEDKWIINVTVTFGRLPETEAMANLEEDIAKAILSEPAYEAYKKGK